MSDLLQSLGDFQERKKKFFIFVITAKLAFVNRFSPSFFSKEFKFFCPHFFHVLCSLVVVFFFSRLKHFFNLSSDNWASCRLYNIDTRIIYFIVMRTQCVCVCVIQYMNDKLVSNSHKHTVQKKKTFLNH